MSIEEKQVELAKVDVALDRILTGGQSYGLTSGGGSRQTTYAAYDALIKRKKELEYQIAALTGSLGTRVGAAW